MSRKGFTLIELLVVVAVLALLASIVFSNLGGAREGARISNALSFQSQTHSLLGSDLVGWWNFNHGNSPPCGAGLVCDVSGYGNHATNNGGSYVDGVPGTLGIAMEFSGNADHVSLPYAPQYDIREAITLSVWVKRLTGFNQLTDVHFISRPPSWFFYDSYSSGNVHGDVYIDGIRRAARTTPVPFDNNWYNVTYTYNSATREARIYRNGDLTSSTQLSGLGNYLIDSSGAGFSLIGRNVLGRGLIIDDLRIYSRSLSAQEIQTLYAQTKDNYLVDK